MAPVGTVVHHNGNNKIKRPIPPGIQTNGATPSAKNSPSPLMSAKKPPLSAKQPPHSASERAITASTVRPVNRARRETSSQILGRNSRNSAGLRSASLVGDMSSHYREPPPYVVTDSYILKKHAGRPPSLIVHMHATHFRFDKQDGMFPYKSPMRLFLDHVRSRTVPHDLLAYFTEGGVPFYDGCLIVQVYDHKSATEIKDTRPASTTSTVVASSIHNYNQYLTPSPYVPFPKECVTNPDGSVKVEEEPKDKSTEEKDKENLPAPSGTSDGQKGKGSTTPRIFTVVLHPTPESLQMDLLIKASTPRGANDALGLVPPSTPISLVPPTPTTANMPPPAKRQKRERMEVDGSNIHEVEGQILLATNAPLMLEPTKTPEETIALLEAMAHPKHSEPPPQPQTRKRTVAEVAADEAAAAEQERYMLVLDERLSSSAAGAQSGGATDGDAQTGAATFEPRFERFKVIADIKREHAEKKEQEKIKQQENDRRLQQQRQQQQQEALLAAQRQQAADQERTRREAAAAREAAQRQAEAQRQARAAAATPSNQNIQRPPMAQPQHAHPTQNGAMANNMTNGATGTPTPVTNGMPVQAQPRFQAQISQPPASSPVARQGTPQNMSSPMVGSVPMQQTNSGMAASPPRPSSVVQNHPMSVPMAHNMSSRGSQQSHPSGTPRIPHSTPNIPHGTPINRPAMIATPRMTQASPPPNMMAQNSQMGQAQAMMMNSQAMNQANPQVIAQMAAQQRAIAQQQQQQQMAAMQNGVANGNMNGQAMELGHGTRIRDSSHSQANVTISSRTALTAQDKPSRSARPILLISRSIYDPTLSASLLAPAVTANDLIVLPSLLRQLFSMHPSQLSAFLLPLLVAPVLGGMTLTCENIRVDGHSFDLSKLRGPHSVVTTLYQPSPPRHYNTTYTLDVCGPLKKSGKVSKDEQCPTGTRVCAIKRLLKENTDTIEDINAIAGNLENAGGSQFDYTVTRLKTSDSTSDSQKEGLRLVLKGGKHHPIGQPSTSVREQRAIVEFICDRNKTGTEGEWDAEDKYDAKKFRLRDEEKKEDGDKKDDDKGKEGDGKDGDDKKEGDTDDEKEHQLKNKDASLIWESFTAEKDADVLRLTWYTQYACESRDDNGSGDDGGEKGSWGFFTWFIIICARKLIGPLDVIGVMQAALNHHGGWSLSIHSLVASQPRRHSLREDSERTKLARASLMASIPVRAEVRFARCYEICEGTALVLGASKRRYTAMAAGL
ncbi:hypothetical protein AUP68_04875 [Ilyonectria robusta]